MSAAVKLRNDYAAEEPSGAGRRSKDVIRASGFCRLRRFDGMYRGEAPRAWIARPSRDRRSCSCNLAIGGLAWSKLVQFGT
jgi:hypothetical protein